MISLPKQPKITKEGDNKAIFRIDALYPGYGVTVGNSLRRVLLSSLGGAAITQVKIKSVSHEFSTIPGVLEDVISIIMNLKQLRFKLLTDESQKAVLKIKGEKKVTGKEIKLPSQVELVNKSLHIATLTTKSADLEIEVQIEKGTGYSSKESREKTGASAKEKLAIGVIPIDAFFSPVKRVNYKVENMRVKERTDYDRLFLEIETDGIITPEEAFEQAIKILIDHFSILINDKKEDKEIINIDKKEDKNEKEK